MAKEYTTLRELDLVEDDEVYFEGYRGREFSGVIKCNAAGELIVLLDDNSIQPVSGSALNRWRIKSRTNERCWAEMSTEQQQTIAMAVATGKPIEILKSGGWEVWDLNGPIQNIPNRIRIAKLDFTVINEADVWTTIGGRVMLSSELHPDLKSVKFDGTGIVSVVVEDNEIQKIEWTKENN